MALDTTRARNPQNAGSVEARLLQIADERVFQGAVQALAAGETVTLDVRGLARLTMIPSGGATVSYSLVDSADAAAHNAATQKNVTAKTVVDVDWPFYHVSVSATAGHAARVAGV